MFSHVNQVHAIALANGGTCAGAPGLRPEYHAHDYGAYFRDPDGNKLCVACHQPEQVVAPGIADHLFVYGTLAPGRSNAHVLADIPGTWQPASVRGTVLPEGWGAAAGWPGIVPDEAAGLVEGLLLTSDELAAHWARIDEFEGEGYVRVSVAARLADDSVIRAHVYALREYPRHLTPVS